MGCVELSEIEKKTVPNCKFLWSQSIDNQAERILRDCETPEKVNEFFDECERKIKNIDKDCRIIWNGEVHSFGGDEFAYIWFLYSDLLSSAIKISVNIDIFEKIIVIGNMTIADKNEEKRLEQHLESLTKVESTQTLNTTKALNNQEKKE